MGLFSRIRNEYTIQDWNRDLKIGLGGTVTNAGVTVSEGTALRFSTVYACGQVLSETLGSLPLHVYRKRPGGGADLAPDYPLYERVHDLPNDEMQSQTWLETVTGHLVLSGNTYSILTHNGKGQVIDIYPWPWDQILPRRNLDTGLIEYGVIDRGKTEWLPAYKVLHVPGWGFDGIMGYSRIRMAAQAIGLGMAAAEFAERFYGQGMNTGLVFEYPGELTDPAYERMKADLEEQGAGLGKSWKPFIAENGAKLSRIGIPLADAQFIEGRKFSREEICGIMRVPPHMVADLSRSTNNNIEHQSLEFVMYSMLPIITRFEKSMKWKLLSARERAAGYYLKFNIGGLLRGDSAARSAFYHNMRNDGIMNADEIRELEEMNPQEGGTGKIYVANGNFTRLDQVGQGSGAKGVNDNGSQIQGA